MLRRVGERLRRLRVAALAILVAFWTLQFVGWMAMMVVAESNPRPFTRSLLYTVQISHWALVEAAGTATLSALTLLAAAMNARRIGEHSRVVRAHLEHIHGHVDPAGVSPLDEPPEAG